MVTEFLLQKLMPLAIFSQEHPSKHKCCIKFGSFPVALKILALISALRHLTTIVFPKATAIAGQIERR